MKKAKFELLLFAETVLDIFKIAKATITVSIKTKTTKYATVTAAVGWKEHRSKIWAARNADKFRPAEGEFLDRLGELYGVSRDGKNDADYRRAITIKVTGIGG